MKSKRFVSHFKTNSHPNDLFVEDGRPQKIVNQLPAQYHNSTFNVVDYEYVIRFSAGAGSFEHEVTWDYLISREKNFLQRRFRYIYLSCNDLDSEKARIIVKMAKSCKSAKFVYVSYDNEGRFRMIR